jgi:C4-type Zn-finger protein
VEIIQDTLIDLTKIEMVDFDKYCPSCGKWKKSSEFYKSSNSSDGLSGHCKECMKNRIAMDSMNGKHYRKYGRAYYNENKSKELSRALVKNYGITREDKRAMLESQNYKCPICGQTLELDGRKTHLDHDHKTGKIRGVLCDKCNKGLGNFNDDIERMKSAIAYLEAHNGTR